MVYLLLKCIVLAIPEVRPFQWLLEKSKMTMPDVSEHFFTIHAVI